MGLEIEDFAEYELMRQFGKCNMLDLRCVYRYAKILGLKRLQKALEENHSKKYRDIIMNYPKVMENPILQAAILAETEELKKKICMKLIKLLESLNSIEDEEIRRTLLESFADVLNEESIDFFCK